MVRTFKTAWFSRSAKKARISDTELCRAIRELALQDRANIENDELAAFRKLAALYRRKTSDDLEAELRSAALVEICNGT